MKSYIKWLLYIYIFFFFWKSLEKLKKLELSPQKFRYDVLHLLYSADYLKRSPEILVVVHSNCGFWPLIPGCARRFIWNLGKTVLNALQEMFWCTILVLVCDEICKRKLSTIKLYEIEKMSFVSILSSYELFTHSFPQFCPN